MLNHRGDKVMVTPSVLYGDEFALTTVSSSGFCNGFIFIREDGIYSDEYGSRMCWLTIIYDSNGEVIYTDNEGVHGPRTNESTPPLEALRAFVSFLTACAEAQSEESENYNLFDTKTREWAEMVSDELTMISVEIEEELGNG